MCVLRADKRLAFATKEKGVKEHRSHKHYKGITYLNIIYFWGGCKCTKTQPPAIIHSKTMQKSSSSTSIVLVATIWVRHLRRLHDHFILRKYAVPNTVTTMSKSKSNPEITTKIAPGHKKINCQMCARKRHKLVDVEKADRKRRNTISHTQTLSELAEPSEMSKK